MKMIHMKKLIGIHNFQTSKGYTITDREDIEDYKVTYI